MPKCDTSSVVAWLVDGARSAQTPQLVLDEMCRRLCNCDIPLWRVDVFVRTLQPKVVGRRFRWQQGNEVSVSTTTFDLAALKSRTSLVEHVCANATAIRKRPTDLDSEIEFPLLKELWADAPPICLRRRLSSPPETCMPLSGPHGESEDSQTNKLQASMP